MHLVPTVALICALFEALTLPLLAGAQRPRERGPRRLLARVRAAPAAQLP
jgi:hypothetical protein